MGALRKSLKMARRGTWCNTATRGNWRLRWKRCWPIRRWHSRWARAGGDGWNAVLGLQCSPSGSKEFCAIYANPERYADFFSVPGIWRDAREGANALGGPGEGRPSLDAAQRAFGNLI